MMTAYLDLDIEQLIVRHKGSLHKKKTEIVWFFNKGGVPPPFSEVWYNFCFFQGKKPETT